MIITDISGKWDVFLDEDKSDRLPEKYLNEINLPDSTSNAGLGRLNTETEYGCLTDMHKFEGFAWFRRIIEITPEMAGQNITLFLERTRKTRLFLDGKPIGSYCSLCAPHRYSLNGTVPGVHEVVICVDNTDYLTGGGHLTSRDTQTNWNGILGRIELQAYRSYPEAVCVIPDVESGSVHVRAEIAGEQSGTAVITVSDDNREYGSAAVKFSKDTPLECDISLPGAPFWSDSSPKMLRLEIDIDGDKQVVSFGMRRLSGDDKTLLINGSQTFLRGKHDGLVFPETGFMPTDLNSWLKYMETLLRYGINHIRYHTCCPPEAAFEAADILGIYMQPELPFWGTVPEQFGAEHEFLRQEGWRILREFGHHPSFVMMSMGNELWGSKDRLNEIISGYKSCYPDKMYAGGSNNFQFVPCVLEQEDFFSGVRLGKDRLIRGSYAMCDAPQGHIQTNYPNSVHNYDPLIDEEAALSSDETTPEGGTEIMIQYGTEMKKVSAESWDNISVHVPVISHEVGQYAVFPDFDEIDEYKGSLRHEAYASYREGLKQAGMLHRWRDFFRASGALAVDCYRRDIETAMRSSLLSGFQLLDIQDFPGQGVATVGILNAHMKSKGLITPEEWRQFCGDTVLLALLNGFVYEAGEEINCGIQASCTSMDLTGMNVNWELILDGKQISGGVSDVFLRNGRIFLAHSISFSVNCDRPAAARLHIWIEGIAENSYTLYFYPKIDVRITEKEISSGGRSAVITQDFEQAKRGGAVFIPALGEESLAGEYCTDFWCYGMFRSISESMGKPVPTGTLGLLIDNKSALLSEFPCETHTTPQWYEIVTHSRCADLDGTDIEPDVWVIDNPERHKRLGLLYCREGVICCTSRLWEIADRPEVKWFAKSLLDAVSG